jgi:hypothetical protein
MPYIADYPATLAEVLDPPVRFRPAVIEAVNGFARSKPYRGEMDEPKEKFRTLHDDLCRIYGNQTRLIFGIIDGSDSGSSHYCRFSDEIVLCGKLSVVTALQEFAHALGKDEREAARWSANLFRECFPRSFARCRTQGHMLRSRPQPKALCPHSQARPANGERHHRACPESCPETEAAKGYFRAS